MSSSENEDDAKKIARRPEPLCLFCCPHDPENRPPDEDWYVAGGRGESPGRASPAAGRAVPRSKWSTRRRKQEPWLRRRKELGWGQRRKVAYAGRLFGGGLLASVKPRTGHQEEYIPFLIEALRTVKNAWPPNKCLLRDLDENTTACEAAAMMPQDFPAEASFGRRSSVPEEVMRRFLLKKSATSEESEANRTVPDANSTSSNDRLGEEPEEAAARSPERSRGSPERGESCLGGREDSDRRAPETQAPRKRATQTEFDKQGRGIIRAKTREKGSQAGRYSNRSETSPTARQTTEESRTSDSVPSSSPVELARRTTDVSSSGNVSSESEDVPCTCADVSSKETSTDLFRSGNSTLSQTVSEKSVSTQDSTVSIQSVSTGGSTTSGNSNSNSSSPEIFARTSAKETSSPEPTPRTKIGGEEKFLRGRRCLRHRLLKGKCGKFRRRRPRCRWHRLYRCRNGRDASEEELREEDEVAAGDGCCAPLERGAAPECVPAECCHGWPYTAEEIYMMQQLRHRTAMESRRRRFALGEEEPVSACASHGSVCPESEDLEEQILIPRYSALPRTLSMLVNTSSADGSGINSDSDSLSLADSLEDSPAAHVHRIPHDTKWERKPVRGDVNAPPETKKVKQRNKHPRGRAFFVSIKEPYGEDELLAGIAKIPEPPERIKERIRERQLDLLRLQKLNLERRREEEKENKNRKGGKRVSNGGRLETRANLRTKDMGNEREVGRKENTGKELGRARACYGSIARKGRTRLWKKVDREQSKCRASVNSSTASTSPDGEITRCRGKKKNKESRRRFEEKGEDEEGTRCPREVLWETKPPNGAESRQKPNGEKAEEPLPPPPPLQSEKPQAVIHPSQLPTAEAEMHRRNKPMPLNQARAMRFRQRFEAIPEEKSSSMSSAEDKSNRGTGAVQQPPRQQAFHDDEGRTESERSRLRRSALGSAPDLVLAKLMETSLQVTPSEKSRTSGENPILLVSPKVLARTQSQKGRDALIAMNREDFNRLSKGWMNFYVLKETSDASEGSANEEKQERKDGAEERATSDRRDLVARKEEQKTGRRDGALETSDFRIEGKPENGEVTESNSGRSRAKEATGVGPGEREAESEKARQKKVKKMLDDCVRFHASNSILKPMGAGVREPKRLSLPELGATSAVASTARRGSTRAEKSSLVLPRVNHKAGDCDCGVDSDSTVYCQPPSLIVPRLAFDGTGDFPSDSDSDSDSKKAKKLPANYVPLRKRGFSHRAKQKDVRDAARHGNQGRGFVPRGRTCRPMAGGDERIGPNANGYSTGPSGWSVTVAGTVDLSSATPDLEMRLCFPAKGCGPPLACQSDSGFAEEGSQNLDACGGGQDCGSVSVDGGRKHTWTVTVTNPKPGEAEGTGRKSSKSGVLPSLGQPQPRKAMKVLKDRSAADHLRDCHGKMSIYWPRLEIAEERSEEPTKEEDELSVRGAAMAMEKKPRAPTMTERDLIRGLTSRSCRSDSKNSRSGEKNSSTSTS